MAQETIIGSGLDYLPHIAMWDELVKSRLAAIDLSVLLVYMIDTVDASALPFLAEQFGIQGYRGYRLALTVDDKRALIKNAIQLQKYRGTLWAIENAISLIGFGDAAVQEHVDGHWANFRVVINVLGKTVTDGDVAALRELILYWKNERSHLTEIAIEINEVDSFSVDAEANLNQYDIQDDSMSVGGNFLLNGTVRLDGSRNLSRDSDTLILNIV